MLSDQRLCGRMHGLRVERTMDPRRARALQRRARAAVQYAVAVDAANRLVACVKSQRHLARPTAGLCAGDSRVLVPSTQARGVRSGVRYRNG